MLQIKGTCGNCGAFSAMDGECRRARLGALMLEPGSGKPIAVGYFPTTSKGLWCAQWVPEAQQEKRQ